jgi:pimeloyl-ACP methyl ester carboxylesterase
MIRTYIVKPIVWLISAIVILAIVGVGSGLGYRAWQQSSIRAATAITNENGVESLEEVEVNGSRQWIYLRGHDANNPVLLFVHGGPGLTEMWGAREFGLEVEKHFTVVHWDQRGAGKSKHAGYALSDLTLDTYVNDTLAMVNHLRARFEQDKIFIVGHSWGTILATLAVRDHPELFHAYVGVSQMVNIFENETLSLRFAREQAEADGNLEAVAAMENIAPPYSEENMDDLGVQRRWLAYYGGSMRGVSILEGIDVLFTSPEYTLADIMAVTSMGDTAGPIWPQLADLDFFTQAPELKVPVYFFAGRHDYQTPFEITERYFEMLKAPHKEIVWFENSAHVAVFSDPDRYQKMLIEKVLPGPPSPASAPLAASDAPPETND